MVDLEDAADCDFDFCRNPPLKPPRGGSALAEPTSVKGGLSDDFAEFVLVSIVPYSMHNNKQIFTQRKKYERHGA